MSIAANIIKMPHGQAFSKNPVMYVIGISPYTVYEQQQGYYIIVNVEIETSYGSGVYRTIKTQRIYPNIKGLVTFDIATFLDSYLNYYIQETNVNYIVPLTTQQCFYKINYTLYLNEIAVGATKTHNPIRINKGGLAIEQWNNKNFFDTYILANTNSLEWDKARKINIDDPYYCSFYYYFAGTNPMEVLVTLHKSDGTTATHSILSNNPVGESGSLYSICIDFAAINVIVGLVVGVVVEKYTISIVTDISGAAAVIVKPFELYVDYRNFYNTYTLVYKNSIGGTQVLRLKAGVDLETIYNFTESKKSLFGINFYKNQLQSATVKSIVSETPKYKGYINYDYVSTVDLYRDIFINTLVKEYAKDVLCNGSNLLPIHILNGNAKLYSNDEALANLSIEWERLTNINYTPKQIVKKALNCPGVQLFEVVQIAKDKVQVQYALIEPYDLIEIEVNNGYDPAYFVYFRGNTGNEIIPFTAPPNNGSNTINFKARTVCNEHTQPMGVSAWSADINFVPIYDFAPILLDNYYDVAQNTTNATTFETSVLNNDYDPDGDVLQVQPVVNATTTQGGTISINASGMVTYLAATNFTGIDTYVYTVLVGSNVVGTATIHINVGANATKIYVKLVKRNVNTVVILADFTNNINYTTADVYLEFYSNQACTIPKNINSLALTINYEKNVTTGGTPVLTNLSVPGAGTAVHIFSGIIKDVRNLWIQTTEFKTLAGVGYIAV